MNTVTDLFDVVVGEGRIFEVERSWQLVFLFFYHDLLINYGHFSICTLALSFILYHNPILFSFLHFAVPFTCGANIEYIAIVLS